MTYATDVMQNVKDTHFLTLERRSLNKPEQREDTHTRAHTHEKEKTNTGNSVVYILNLNSIELCETLERFRRREMSVLMRNIFTCPMKLSKMLL